MPRLRTLVLYVLSNWAQGNFLYLNIRSDIKQIWCTGEDWIHPIRGRDQWRGLAKKLMYLWVPEKEGNLLNSSETVSLSSMNSLKCRYTPCWVNVLWNLLKRQSNSDKSVFLPGAAPTPGMSHAACVQTAIFVNVNVRKVVVSTDGHWLALAFQIITFP
jgi:hypothetical protein